MTDTNQKQLGNTLWAIADLARTQNTELLNTLQAAFQYIETESFESTCRGLFSETDKARPDLQQYPVGNWSISRNRRVPEFGERCDRRRTTEARRSPAPQARPDAEAFPFPKGGIECGTYRNLTP